MTTRSGLTLGLALLGFVGAMPMASEETATREVALLDVAGAIGPATSDYLRRGITHAAEEGAPLVIIRIDTPGGLDAATRDINRAILGSTVPIAVYVAPEGARAASAGTYIVYASHLAVMAPATSLGAATPVALGGASPSPDDGVRENDDDKKQDGDTSKEKTGDTHTRKAVNDSVAYLRTLAQLRGRSEAFAEDAVRNAATLTAREALERGVIDLIATDVEDLLRQAEGRRIKIGETEITVHSAGIPVRLVAPDWRSRVLSVITDPTVAYLLLLIGLYGLIFEGYSPGAVLPGVVGAISLLLALYALQLLPVSYAGVALIVLGVALLVTEVFMPSFGALGIGGLIALLAGSIMLLDTEAPGFAISRSVVIGIGAATAVGFAMLLHMAARARMRPVTTGAPELVGQPAIAIEDFERSGYVRIRGEIWQAQSPHPVRRDQLLRVEAIEGLVLRVRPDNPT